MKKEKLRVLMIGGTGVISTDCTLRALANPEIDLFLLNRGKSPNFLPEHVRIIPCDINDPREAALKTENMNFDVICDFISYDPGSLQKKLNLFHGRCGQYIFISSVAAYRFDPSVKLRTERNMRPGCVSWSYGYEKTLCERLLMETCASSGMKFTIVRPSYTCSPVRFFNPYTIPHSLSWTIAARMLAGKAIVLQDDGSKLCTVTHTEDFAKGFVGLFGNPNAFNTDFHITSQEYLSWRKIAEIQAELLEVPIRFCFVPTDDLCLKLNWSAAEKLRHTAFDECYDSSKIASAVPEFQVAVPFRESMKRSIRFYRENPSFQHVDPWWDAAFDRIAEQYGETQA